MPLFPISSGFRSDVLPSVRLLPCLALSLLWLHPIQAGADFQPRYKPSLEIHPTAEAIEIDGDLQDPGWRTAAVASGFAENYPGDGSEPPVDTRVWMTYDETNLYIAILAQDEPDEIRASWRDRDHIWADDYVGIMLDTYGSSSWAYEIFLNPYGIQGDLRLTANNEDMSFDVVFHSEGQITEEGFQVEIAIPFRSLRFPDAPEQTWRMNLWRNHPRDSRRRYSWSAIDRDDPCFLCQFGTLTGIRNVRPGGKFEVLPSVTSKQVGELTDRNNPRSDFANESIDGDAELGVRYTFTSSASGELTINPDFSQIEADAGQIDVNTTFALFFPERRPFFQEGSDLYDTWINTVYTRSINDPSLAGKLTGRTGKSNLGYFVARDERSPVIIPLEEKNVLAQVGGSLSNVARYRYSLKDNSHLGVIATNRILDDGGSNTVFGADTQLRFLRNYQLETQWVAAYTEEPVDPVVTAGEEQERFDYGKHSVALDGEDFWGRAGYISLERNARVWDFDLDYWETSPTFRADNGFVTQNDNRRAMAWSGLSLRIDNEWLDEILPNVNLARVWNFDGARKDEWIRPEISVQFKAQTNAWIAHLWSEELFRGVEFGDIRRWSAGVGSNYSEIVQAGVSGEWGKTISRSQLVLGNGRSFSAWADIKPSQRLVLEPTFSFSRLEHPDGEELFSGYIFRSRANYQFTRQLFVRLVVQYNDFDKQYDIDPLLTYKINPFTVFYFGSTHDIREIRPDENGPRFDPEFAQTERQFFMKLQYLFRL